MHPSIGNKRYPKEPLPCVLAPEHQSQLVNKTHLSSQGIARVNYGGKPDRHIAKVLRASDTDLHRPSEVAGMCCCSQRFLLQIGNVPVRLEANLPRLKRKHSMSTSVFFLRTDEHQGVIKCRCESRDDLNREQNVYGDHSQFRC
ncbi:mitochondrial inner membrane peptidase [Pseudozyma hubeiensis SY62]|uniref:Mitochondrial inner membrane peptidase n=1 Tax=Pseudozyma hubeiensis (strain SY62) TaxID=1305764 RepID=R9P017_PSEHS|nr:mitochondrial inner membrane peptidase [Pseudozyma hubeiensis SY62]GAC94451.1 mitochondrial inner membrane peptidase [Pseudozyma hubeiensis SY62]